MCQEKCDDIHKPKKKKKNNNREIERKVPILNFVTLTKFTHKKKNLTPLFSLYIRNKH